MEKELKEKYIKLYELTLELYELSPWNYLWDNEILCYVPLKKNKLYYASILGKGGIFKGIVIIDDDNINRYLEIMKDNFNPIHLLSYQNGYMINFIEPKDLRADEKIIPNELGVKFKDIAFTFKEYKIGYFPYELQNENIDLIIDLLSNYISLIKHIKNKEIVPQENHMILRMEEEKNKYKNACVDFMVPEKNYQEIKIDESIIEEFKKLKKSSNIYEIDFMNYLALTVGSNYIEKINSYKLPRFFALSNFKISKMIKFDIEKSTKFDNDIDYYKDVLSDLINYILDTGYLPKTIYVRDIYTKSLLKSLEDDCGIEIKIEKLNVIDSFIKLMMQNK